MTSQPIRQWAIDDRPREKLLSKGPEALSNSELIAILLQSGKKGKSAVALAREILDLGKNSLERLGRLRHTDLKRLDGMGQAKSVILLAALELGRRRQVADDDPAYQVHCSRDLYDLLRPEMMDLGYEALFVVFLNNGNYVLDMERVSSGGLSQTTVDPRIIFRKALEREATGIVLCHNHPGGVLDASAEDLECTRRLEQAGRYLQIRVMDHLILTGNDYFSFRDQGMLG